jgi:hypothetical protein
MTIQRVACFIAALFLISTSALASEPETFGRILMGSGPVTLNIQSGPGGIHISPGSSSSVIVHAVIRSVLVEQI